MILLLKSSVFGYSIGNTVYVEVPNATVASELPRQISDLNISDLLFTSSIIDRRHAAIITTSSASKLISNTMYSYRVSDDSYTESKISGGEIAGIVISILGACFCCGLFYKFCCKKEAPTSRVRPVSGHYETRHYLARQWVPHS